ncbi:NAD(P)-dependent oxidoreductase [Alkalihalobacillus pseudalcaliphilus]|uniref:NAD(P)-dependent oxidoreductase n=1 Tax=Alkalihalobacillus pseudalcaliphilus TaxID=79884 RepID=UPI00064DBAD4|nr:NAD(P)-dependent oxidoreductase [Alkalihalobacillus pseudalcaliphilus]KMK76058.1 hypothetical protein AB990_12565 [Alkalihalobacillus pseudalcaliphilus]
MSEKLPILLQLKDKVVAIVGGGPIALRNIKRFLCVGARVVVYAERCEPEISDLFKQGLIRLHERTLTGEEKVEADILCLATNNRVVHEMLKEANPHIFLIYDAANRFTSSFQFMNFMKERHLLVAWSTQGASPIYAKRLKKDLKENLPIKQYNDHLAFLAKARELIQQIQVAKIKKEQLLLAITDETFLNRADRETLLLKYLLDLTDDVK